MALGTTLVVRFRWLPEPQREYLLHIDCAHQDDPLGMSVWILEQLEHLGSRPEWPEKRIIPISENVAILAPRTE